MKINETARPWNWATEKPPLKLSLWEEAPLFGWFYELGLVEGKDFKPKYAGRATKTTLHQRLRAHFTNSHNRFVRADAHRLYYRCKCFTSAELARFVEAVHLAALDYPYNLRNEWAQHWALED